MTTSGLATLQPTFLAAAALLLPHAANAAPVVYTDEASFVAALAALEGETLLESFEDGVVWADSRTSISNPGSAPSVASQGILWTSNWPQNDIATGNVGGSAPDGTYAIFSLPHGNATDSGLYCDGAEEPNVPAECWQDDGLKVASESGGTLYAFGGRIDTANLGKVSFLLDGVDINAFEPDNIDNVQREGEPADNYTFVGVVDADGFLTAELKELRGKDTQQVLLFADDFTLRAAPGAPPPFAPPVPSLQGVAGALVLAGSLALAGLRALAPRAGEEPAGAGRR